MKKITTLLTLIGLVFGVNAQTTNLGGPIGWKDKLPSKLVPVEVMPGYDQAVVDAEDVINDEGKDSPWRFGYKYSTNYSPSTSGIWSTLPNGTKVWQLGISCPDAMTVNLLLENYNLPEGAYLYLYDTDKTNRVGAYTARNNRTDGLLGTELVHGDNIIVEYVEPANAAFPGEFTITDVVHGYRSLNIVQDDLLDKALNSSGDCNVDVNCPLGNGWEDQIRSVAMIVVGGSGICTGALVNNTCDDGTPYFLTANHCLGGSTGSWAFRFNWESPAGTESCATTANSVDPGPPYDQTANGATVLVNGTQADHALLQIDNMTLTDAQNWNCFYAGWDNSDAQTVTQATGIHHPSGDVKKICREDQNPYHTTAGGPTAQVWMIDDWDQGVTEPGSSGSPLFDQNGRIIGQLYGGAAACSGTNDNNQLDYYGRLGVSWPLGIGTYLAPGSCGSATTNDGYDPNAATLPDDAAITSVIAPTGLICASSVDPEVTLKNEGTNTLTSVTINYDIDAGPNNVFNWTGSLAPGANTTVTLPTITTTSGAHVLNASTSLPNGNADSNPGNDAAAGNFTTMANGQPVTIEINTDCWGSEITWEVQDVGTNTLLSGGPYTDVGGGELITVNTCLDPGCYDFIINDSYGDGMYGSQYGSCTVDGDYTITQDNTAQTLATIQATNSDFGNQEINNFCVQSPCTGTLSSSTVEETCFGDNTGSITVSVTGGNAPFTYDIGSGAQGSDTFTNLAQGSYSITVVDASACSNVINVTLGGPAEVTGTLNITDISCNGANDGQIQVTPGNSNPPYTYDIGSGAQGSDTFTGLSANNYTITITDTDGCTGQSSGTVNEPAALSSSFTTTDEMMGNDGSIDLTMSGGTPPYSYSWTGPNSFTSSNEDPSGLEQGTYTCTVTDGNGCTHVVNGVEVDSQLSVGDESIQFSVFPNPSNGIFNIQLINSDAEVKVSIVDVTGRLVYSEQVFGTSLFSIDISDRAAGTYYIRISDGEVQSAKRIVNK